MDDHLGNLSHSQHVLGIDPRQALHHRPDHLNALRRRQVLTFPQAFFLIGPPFRRDTDQQRTGAVVRSAKRRGRPGNFGFQRLHELITLTLKRLQALRGPGLIRFPLRVGRHQVGQRDGSRFAPVSHTEYRHQIQAKQRQVGQVVLV